MHWNSFNIPANRFSGPEKAERVSLHLEIRLPAYQKKYVVLAPTGIAAINAGGSTLHSFFKLPFHPLLPDIQFARNHKDLKYSSDHRKLIQNIELIIIDEISMVRADIIDFIDKFRTYSHNLREPFGGKQLLLVGDVKYSNWSR